MSTLPNAFAQQPGLAGTAPDLGTWLASSVDLMARRRLELAAAHSQMFNLEVLALRLGHSQSTNRASQALDGMLCAARSAIELSTDDPTDAQADTANDDQAWYEPALALQRNFQLQARAWLRGDLDRQDFMRGNEVLVQHTLSGLAMKLGVHWAHGPEQPHSDVLRQHSAYRPQQAA